MSDMIEWTNPTLEGELVLLRPFEESDIPAAWEMVNEPEGNDLTATTEAFTFEQIEAWYRGREGQDERLDLAVVERATGEFAGEVVLNAYDEAARSCSFRVSLRGPDWFGRGLGTEATNLIVEYGFARLGLERITLEVLARNPRARRAYEKAGFVESSEFEEDGERWVAMTRLPARP
jgi:RimJ/RimL family protein N-acetyltransferase